MGIDIFPKVNPDILFIVVPTVASLGIIWPLHGALTRYRADYNGHVGKANQSRITSVPGALRRTWRLEGLAGLYKGALPALAYMATLMMAAKLWDLYSPRIFRLDQMQLPLQWVIQTIWFAGVNLPSTLIIDRCIVTPDTLPYDSRRALPLLLSDQERSAPVSLFTKPGLFLARLIVDIPFNAIAHMAGLPVLIPVFTAPGVVKDLPWPKLLLGLGCHAVWAALVNPLEVIITRLTIQGLPQSPTMIGQNAEVGEKDTEIEVQLSTQNEAYEGIVDCARKIVKKEGYSSLYRGYSWQVIGNIITAAR